MFLFEDSGKLSLPCCFSVDGLRQVSSCSDFLALALVGRQCCLHSAEQSLRQRCQKRFNPFCCTDEETETQ